MQTIVELPEFIRKAAERSDLAKLTNLLRKHYGAHHE